jgi:hypothetical protein
VRGNTEARSSFQAYRPESRDFFARYTNLLRHCAGSLPRMGAAEFGAAEPV